MSLMRPPRYSLRTLTIIQAQEWTIEYERLEGMLMHKRTRPHVDACTRTQHRQQHAQAEGEAEGVGVHLLQHTSKRRSKERVV